MRLAFVLCLVACYVFQASECGYATTNQVLNKLKQEFKKTSRDHIDLVVMLDASKRATKQGFQAAKDAAKKLAKAVDAKSKIDVCSGGGSEVALMVVSDPEKTGVRFRLDREKTLKDVRKEIGDEKYSKNRGSTTDLKRALQQALDVYTIRSNDPCTHKKVLWLATNTDMATDKEIFWIAKHLKKLGIDICIAAIKPNSDNDVNMKLLRRVARDDCFLKFRNWSQYKNRVQNAVYKFVQLMEGNK